MQKLCEKNQLQLQEELQIQFDLKEQMQKMQQDKDG